MSRISIRQALRLPTMLPLPSARRRQGESIGSISARIADGQCGLCRGFGDTGDRGSQSCSTLSRGPSSCEERCVLPAVVRTHRSI